MRILMTDMKRIAEAAGCDPEAMADAALALYHSGNRVEADDYLTKLDDELNTAYRIGCDAGLRSQGGSQEGRMQGRREMLHEMRGRGPLRPVGTPTRPNRPNRSQGRPF